MKHPETLNHEHNARISRADEIREQLDDKEIWEIFERLEEVEQASDALGKAHIRRARDELNAALERISEVLA